MFIRTFPSCVLSNMSALNQEQLQYDSTEEDPFSVASQYQMVLYDPSGKETNESEQLPPVKSHPFSDHTPRVLPAVQAFTVQCAVCFKWRIIPTKEKYEEIREYIMEQPFLCETAREWKPNSSCDDPPDIIQDNSKIWAIDKPSIAQPPPGWQRLMRIRGEGGTRFADVYYVAPTGKRLRSKVEIDKYLIKHPEYLDKGVNISQFSFQSPRPLQENYTRKRTAHPSPFGYGDPPEIPLALHPSEEIKEVQQREPSDEPCSSIQSTKKMKTSMNPNLDLKHL